MKLLALLCNFWCLLMFCFTTFYIYTFYFAGNQLQSTRTTELLITTTITRCPHFPTLTFPQSLTTFPPSETVRPSLNSPKTKLARSLLAL